MNNKKRAFMVPVMTLAVCAIAMVGLGFAISTSVTSDTNKVEKMMIDISGTDFGDAKEPIKDGVVNGLFNITFTTEKEQNEGGFTFTNKVDGGWAYLKIFGNASPETIFLNVSFNVSVPDSESDKTADVKKITLSIYKKNSFPATSIGTVTVENGKNADFIVTEDAISCETDYIVAITSITAESNTYQISYSGNIGSITGAVSGTTNEAVKIGNYNSMTMAFKASNEAAAGTTQTNGA